MASEVVGDEMKRFYAITLTILVGGLLACSSMKVSSSLTEPDSFSQYRTYSWVTPPEGKRSILYENEIMVAVDELMAKKGYKKVVEKIGPDLHLLYQTSTTNKTRIVTESRPHDPYTLMYDQKIWIDSYSEGALLLALEDTKTKKLAWRGIAEDVVDATNRKETERVIQKAVEKLLTSVPTR